MKKLGLLLLALFTFAFVSAQTNKEEVDLMQAAFGMDKKAVVNAFVKVSTAERDAFWKLYDEYETERKNFGKERIDLLNQYVSNYSKLNNEFADSWTKEVIALSTKTDKLMVSYYNKIKKETNPVVALQFYQIEVYILSVIRSAILESIPFPETKE
jgi:hypothetical protein